MLNPIVTANVWNLCNNRCFYCVSSAPNRKKDAYDDGRDFGEVLDVHSLLRWLDRFRPLARLHISGGEPLLYPKIEDWIETVIRAGRKVTLLTNGQLISKNKRLHELPINWIVTYHNGCGVSIDDYKKQLDCLNKNRLDFRVMDTGLKIDVKAWEPYEPRVRQISSEVKTMESWGYKPPANAPCNIASELLTLVENNGSVYACNCKKNGIIGSVYDMTCDNKKAEIMDKRAIECFAGQWCGALNTARIEGETCL